MGERERLFGTDGVRGRANEHPMTAEMALALGQAVAHVFQRRGGDRRHRIIIGKDTRLSGYMFEDALAAGIASMGVDVIMVGPMPTPAMAFLTTDMRCDAGVMISASHNPYFDNGIKFFGRNGFKLPDEIEDRIEHLIASGKLAELRAEADAVGQARRIDDAQGRYVVFLKKTFPLDLTLDGLRVVLDCANGAAYKVGPTILSELGAEVFTVGVEPDGRNINESCGTLHPERAVARLREVRADLGIAVDGDADRVVLIDEKGRTLDGDAILALAARDMTERGVLRGGSVVATHNTTGDGLLTALQILAIMRRRRLPLSKLAEGVERFPQVLLNVNVPRTLPLDDLAAFGKQVRQVESELGDRGRVVIRYSGTEPKARIMVEGDEEARVNELAQDLARGLQKALAAAGG
jgi:phosphoglucosamine mutase